MAEATLDANQQALAPTTGGQVAARPATPATTNTHRCVGENDDVDRNGRYRERYRPARLSEQPRRAACFALHHRHYRAGYLCPFLSLGVAPTYRSVYPGMSEADRQEAKDALDAAGFAPRIDISTGSLQVADERYHEARILLASQDIPRSATAGGFENLLEQGSMTTSRFIEQVSYRAAIETELAASITEIAPFAVRACIWQNPNKAYLLEIRFPPRRLSS